MTEKNTKSHKSPVIFVVYHHVSRSVYPVKKITVPVRHYLVKTDIPKTSKQTPKDMLFDFVFRKLAVHRKVAIMLMFFSIC